MKRQIDPNLNNSSNDLSLQDVIGIKDNNNDKINNSVDDIINSLTGVDEKKDEVNFSIVAEKVETSISTHHSSDEHHHHSSGEHHHSSGEHHHHSGSGHHHSSGEHHHHSSGEHHHHSSSGHHHSGSGHHHHHHHHSHHSESDKKKKIVLKVLIAIIAIILAIVLIIVGTFAYLQQKGKKDVKNTVISAGDYQETIEYKGHTYKFNEDVVSFAFMGVDQREMKTNDETDFVGSADADIVIAVNTKTGVTRMIAIPRDTMVDIDIFSESGIFLKTENSQLCLAYAYGNGEAQSCENVVKAMSRVLYNVPIQKYFALNLEGIAPLNDAVGGVTVDPLYSMPEYGIFKGQPVTLKGDNAEHYVRTRDMVDLNASLNRTDRQVQYVKAFTTQLLPAVMKDFGIISRLYNTASAYSQSNISLSNVTYIASLALSKNITSYDTYTITGKMAPSKTTKYSDVVYAEFTPDEDSVMEAVLAVYYTQID